MANDEKDELDKKTLEFLNRRTELCLRLEKALDDQIERMSALNFSSVGMESVMKDAAILTALSTRSLTERQHLVATEQSVLAKAMIDAMGAAATALTRTDESTKRLANWTRGLVFATWALGISAIVAALIGLYGLQTVPPEIISVTAPPTPPIIVTPAPVIVPTVPARAAPR